MRKNNPGSASLRAAARTKGRNSAEGHILLSPFFPILKRDAPHRGRAASCQSPTAAVSGNGEGRTLTQTDDGPLWMLSHSPDGHSWSGLLTRSLFISPTLWTRISSTSPSATQFHCWRTEEAGLSSYCTSQMVWLTTGEFLNPLIAWKMPPPIAPIVKAPPQSSTILQGL